MKKRLFLWVLSLLTVLCLLPAVAHAATVDSGKCGDNVTWTLDDAGTLTISGSGEMWNLSDVEGQYWNADAVKRIVVKEGITTIYGFSHMDNLTSVSLPNSLETIAFYAFSCCENLTSIVIPDSVTTIGRDAFSGCSALTDVRLPKNLTSIEMGLFDGCDQLRSIDIPNKVTSIGWYAFSRCRSLTSVDIPDSVTSVGTQAFSYCPGLKEVNFGSGVTGLGERAFWECVGLEELVIPGTMKSTGYYTFQGCTNLTDVTIEYGVSRLGAGSFAECSKLTSIVIPDSVTEIGADAFYSCTNLQAVSLSGGCTKISYGTFENCKNLQVVILPASIELVAMGAFTNCPSLAAVYYLGDVEDLDSLYVESDNNALLNAEWYLAMIASKSPVDATTSVGGKSVTFTAEASHPKAKYQWLYLAPGSDEWAEVTDLTGRNTKKLTVPAKAKYDGYQFACYMYQDTGDYGIREAVSDPATMTVVPGPNYAYKLNNTMAAKGKTATLTVEGTGTGITYTWYYAEPGSSTYNKSSVTGNTYSLTMNDERDGRRVYCKITDKYGASVTTNVVTLRMGKLDVPAITLTNKAESGKPSLTWKAAEGAAKYEVWRATSKNGPYTKMYTTTGTAYSNTTAEVGKTYYYKVRSINADGYVSSFCTAKSITCDLPAPVITLTNKAESGKPSLTWKAVDGAIKYEVYRATSKSGTYTKMYTTTGLSYVNTTAEVGKTYYYKVRAISDNQYATSGYSTVKSITCDLPAPVTSLYNSSASGKPTLTWKAVDGAIKYEVYRATSKNGSYSKMYTTTGLSYTNTTAEVGKTYYYKVRAISDNTYATSGYSTIKSITCDLPAPVVSITLNSAGQPKLTWKAVDGAIKYEVYRATSKDGSYSKMLTTTNLSYTNTSAAEGTTYYYKVRAIAENSYANSAYSTVKSITAK